MPFRRIVEIAALCVAVLTAILAISAWLASHNEQQRLQATLSCPPKISPAKS